MEETRILVIEDDKIDQMAFRRFVKDENLSYNYTIAGSVSEAKGILNSQKFDVVIIDYHLGDGTAFDIFDLIIDTPVIITTGTGDEGVAVKAMKGGAYDYLIKDLERNYLKILPITVENAIKHKKSEKQFRMLSHAIMSINDSVYVTDMDNRIIFVNKAFCRTYGYEEEDILGRHSDILWKEVSTGEDVINVFSIIIEGSWKDEFYHKRKDGSEFPVSLSRSIIKDENGNEVAVVGVARDITERQQMLMELEQTQKQQLQMKDRFLSHVSHELRTPLAAIYQFVTIFLDGLAGDLTYEQREYLEIILKNVNQLQTMIGDLLEVTRAETGKLTVERHCIFMGELIAETISTLRATAVQKGIILSADIPSDLPPAYADPKRVRQILVNLIDNGIKFTPENGKVTVQAHVFGKDPNFLCIAVADTGCGISPEGTQMIFERLYQEANIIKTSRKGLGLGLYICKELVSRHGGQIWVESQIGHGSVFYFTLPVFSLASLLLPVIVEDSQLRDSVALITVDVSPLGRSSSTKIGEAIPQEVRNILQRCILPDDLLLPKITYNGGEEIFFIVLCTDQSGIEVVVHRIWEQLGRSEILQNANIDPAVSFTMVHNTPQRRNNESLEQLVRDVANKVEELMKTKINKEGLTWLEKQFS